MLGVAVVLAASTGAIGVGRAAAQPLDGGSLTGRVADAGGNGVAGICVNIDNGPGTQSDDEGDYRFDELAPGSYRVRYSDCRAEPLFVEQWYSGRSDSGSSDPVEVIDGQETQMSQVSLVAGVVVRGRVTDEDAQPIAGINVNVNPTGNGQSGWGQTGPDGSYRTSPLPPGDYRVQFSDSDGGATWAGTYWDQQLTWDAATIFTISPSDSGSHDGIDAVLGHSASVAGTVTGPGGVPAEGICVYAAADTGSGPQGVNGASTDSDGTYTMRGLHAGTYRIGFDDCNGSGPFVREWFEDSVSYAAATAVTLAAGEQRTGVDAELASAASISGTVSGPGGPVEGICVQASSDAGMGGFARTNGSGEYHVVISAAGSYRVQFVDCREQPSLAGQWAHVPGTQAPRQIELTPGQTVDGIDAALVAGATGSISGRVVNADGVAMTTACVVVYLPYEYALFGPIGPDGSYHVDGVPAGT